MNRNTWHGYYFRLQNPHYSTFIDVLANAHKEYTPKSKVIRY